MHKLFKHTVFISSCVLLLASCKQKEYAMGELTAPTDLVVTAEVLGQNTANPNGDGSGNVKITVAAKNALSYKVDYDAADAVDLVYLPTGSVTKKYTKLGVNTYRITAVAYGKGGTATSVTKEVTVKSDFTPDATLVTNVTGGSSKTWVVDQSVPGHFGVGPWELASVTPAWWSAGINEKVACCNCFYTATFTFRKVAASNTYNLQVTSPNGAFTKTGALASIPGIPGGGDEGCYAYGGGTGDFTFVPASSGIAAGAPSTQTSILLAGNATYIGYGSLQKEYEIMVVTPTYMYLRVQGTETGNAWYIKLKAQ
nr:hypothetical protein [uncultured Lacibacter sp.]